MMQILKWNSSFREDTILTCIAHLAPNIIVGDQVSLLNGMEAMMASTGINNKADPHNLDALLFDILKANSKDYAGKVANGGFYKFQEENKAFIAAFGEMAIGLAYTAIMYGMTGGRNNLTANLDIRAQHVLLCRQKGDAMKVSELTKLAKKHGCYIKRHGSEHDIWINPITGNTARIPRHKSKEVAIGTAQNIIKDLGMK